MIGERLLLMVSPTPARGLASSPAYLDESTRTDHRGDAQGHMRLLV
jgi:hypothetical protein